LHATQDVLEEVRNLERQEKEVRSPNKVNTNKEDKQRGIRREDKKADIN